MKEGNGADCDWILEPVLQLLAWLILPIYTDASGIEILVQESTKRPGLLRKRTTYSKTPDGKRGIAYTTLNRLINGGET